MNLLYCAKSLRSGGGTERVLSTKVNWLINKGHNVSILLEDDNINSFFELNPKIILKRISDFSSKSYFSSLQKYINHFNPDICIAVSGKAIKTLPKCKDKSPKILEFHYTKNFLVNFVKGLDKLPFRQLHIIKMKWLQYKLAHQAKRFDKFIGLTKRDVELWGNPTNMTYIYNPLSFRTEKKADCSSKKIIAVGSWTPAKGMDQLLEAFGPLSAQYPDWHLDLYGNGQDEQLLKDIIKKYGMENSVSLNAPIKNIREKLLESSIYAFPSRSDGFGLVITEAMECGLPTVAMDCPCGPKEILSNNSGILVPHKDIKAFRLALQNLMDNKNLRKEMGKFASEEVIRFYPDQIMTQWICLFRHLLGIN